MGSEKVKGSVRARDYMTTGSGLYRIKTTYLTSIIAISNINKLDAWKVS